MKGIVFTEFLEMVQAKFGFEMVDYIIESSDLKSKGAYTSIGTYDFGEMLQLISHLSQKTTIPKETLIFEYGLYFFNYLEKAYPYIFEQYQDPFSFLKSVENHIHVQVRKIYPDAELPTFDVKEINSNQLEMIYYSKRALYKFAEALIQKTFEHYHKNCTVTLQMLKKDGTEVKFEIDHD
ncbi:heme NO-binding domain-containing protein [Algoriphagus pacificus]|uniref:Heme NO-binding domain-containing protein n=1 Tax=Algoriphagus pacificus TaxID=2811234 RepID=A0ABS3CKP6_9BACT|nr:heme NO-binding domain-containing protein [Algoriphagus pacificus]MBN7817688.1 heme NO-binding domain-containing protein [Algoriphagus pacificus]